MNALKIDTGIPVGRHGYRYQFPFSDMKIGDSFFVPGAPTTGRGRMVVANAMRRARSTYRFEFISRSQDGGIRVWRVA